MITLCIYWYIVSILALSLLFSTADVVDIAPPSPYLAKTISVHYSMLSCAAFYNQSVVVADTVRHLRKLNSSRSLDTLKLESGESELDAQIRPRLLCIIYTIESNHHAVTAVVDTWGGECTGFLAFSNATDPTIPTLSIPHEGVESYDNIWAKVASVWKYVHVHYSANFDYFLIGGDDMYVRVESMLEYLKSPEIVAANAAGVGLYMGRRFKINNTELMFNTGGAGYILNKQSLSVLATSLEAGQCSHLETSAEDVIVANCLRASGIVPWNTQDDFGADRFHHFAPHMAWVYPRPGFPGQEQWWYDNMVDYHGPGDAAVSAASLTFHWVRTPYMDALHQLLLCIEEERQQTVTNNSAVKTAVVDAATSATDTVNMEREW